MSARLVYVLSASVASALSLGSIPLTKMAPIAPRLRVPGAAVMCEPAAVAEDAMLITLDGISENYRMQVEKALMERNKERIMSGMPKYESVEAMVRRSF